MPFCGRLSWTAEILTSPDDSTDFDELSRAELVEVREAAYSYDRLSSLSAPREWPKLRRRARQAGKPDLQTSNGIVHPASPPIANNAVQIS